MTNTQETVNLTNIDTILANLAKDKNYYNRPRDEYFERFDDMKE